MASGRGVQPAVTDPRWEGGNRSAEAERERSGCGWWMDERKKGENACIFTCAALDGFDGSNTRRIIAVRMLGDGMNQLYTRTSMNM